MDATNDTDAPSPGGSSSSSDGTPRRYRIDEAHRETGLPKETLRAWERRYPFPRPTRDAAGERNYSQADVDKLRLMKKLVDRGYRPSAIVDRPAEALRDLLIESEPRAAIALDDARLIPFLQLIKAHDFVALREQLGQAMHRQGLELFVVDTVAPLTTAVGASWVTGDIEVFEEHLYSETLQSVLRNAIAMLPARESRPVVLLTTPPGEMHQLGLLMAQALFALEGAQCLSLGPQTPLRDIARAVSAHNADIVAMSISLSFSLAGALSTLNDLDQLLPPYVEVWIGGTVTRELRTVPSRTRILPALADIRLTLQSWRAARASRS